MSPLLDYLDSNNWEALISALKKEKVKPFSEVRSGYYISHLAVLQHQTEMIQYLLSEPKYRPLFEQSDREGNTPLHHAAKLGHWKIFQQIAQRYPETINMLNHLHHSPIWYFLAEPKKLLWIQEKIPKVEFYLADYKGKSLMEKLIKLQKKKDDAYYQLLDRLVTLEKSQQPEAEPVLINAARFGKIDLVKLFLAKGLDPNHKNKYMETAFSHAVFHNHPEAVKLLVKAGADLNYRGVDGRNNPIAACLLHENYELIFYLLEKGYQPDNQNMQLYTDAHLVLMKPDLQVEVLYRILYYSDLNIQNLNGDTPLHLICAHWDWRVFDQLLQYKELDIFKKNQEGKTPLSYLDKKDLKDFYQLVSLSYLDRLKQWKLEDLPVIDPSQGRCTKATDECLKLLKTHIQKEHRSVPDLKKDRRVLKNLKLIKNKEATFGRFSADYVNGLIYCIMMMEQYPQLAFPFQYYDETIQATDTNNRCFIGYREPFGNVISDITDIFHNVLYELAPSIIIWRNRWLHYFHPRVKLALKKLIYATPVRFIFMKLSLAVSTTVVHANAIIYDKEKKILERFEPYGALNTSDAEYLSQRIYQLFEEVVPLKEGEKIEMITPEDYRQDIGFQTVSNDAAQHVRKLGDPTGYCLAWTLWYLEMRMNNPEMHPRDLIRETFQELINQRRDHHDELAFINFIRNYSHKLDRWKNQFLKRNKFKPGDYYTLVHTQKQIAKITQGMVKSLDKIMASRIRY